MHKILVENEIDFLACQSVKVIPDKMTDLIESIKNTTTDYFKSFSEGFIDRYLEDNEEGSEIVQKMIKLWSKEKNQSAFKDHLIDWSKTNSKLLQPKKKKSVKKGPKKNRTSYIIFGQHIRSSIKEEHPDFMPKDVSREMGKRWNLIKDNKALREKYDALAEEDKQRYLSEKEKFTDEDSSSEADIKKLKDPNRPKRGLSAYMFYCKSNRDRVKSELPEGSMATAIAKKLGEEWNLIRTDKKKTMKFDKLAAEDKKRYTEEMESYTEPSQEDIEASIQTKKDQMKLQRKDKPKKTKKPVSDNSVPKEKTKAIEKATSKPVVKSQEIKAKVMAEKKKLAVQQKRVIVPDEEDEKAVAEEADAESEYEEEEPEEMEEPEELEEEEDEDVDEM